MRASGQYLFYGASAFGLSSQADTGDTAANTTAAAYGWPPGTPRGGARTSVGLPELIACDMARMGCWQWHAIDVSEGRVASIDELLDRAVAAINRGDRVAASALADQVLAVDGGNAEAEEPAHRPW